LLRLVLGVIFVAHGGQKLFGLFGGGGIAGATDEMRNFGLHPARINGLAAGASEFCGGTLLAAGFLTPLACTMTCSAMLTAIWSACLPRGFFARNDGVEYPMLLAVALVVVAGEGPGPVSIDQRLDLDRSGAAVALTTLTFAAVGSLGVFAVTRQHATDSSRMT
jgi:putative oxidoreductase